MPSPTELLISGHRIPRSRLVDYIVSGNRNRMILKLKDPVEVIRIDGDENVTATILELNYDGEDEDGFREAWRE